MVKNLFILDLRNNTGGDYSAFRRDDLETKVFRSQDELLTELSGVDDSLVFILSSSSNNNFIVSVSEYKLFNHAYYLFTDFTLNEFDKLLFYSLGYQGIGPIPESIDDWNDIYIEFSSPSKAA
jgi:hypothetical protein